MIINEKGGRGKEEENEGNCVVTARYQRRYHSAGVGVGGGGKRKEIYPVLLADVLRLTIRLLLLSQQQEPEEETEEEVTVTQCVF